LLFLRRTAGLGLLLTFASCSSQPPAAPPLPAAALAPETTACIEAIERPAPVVAGTLDSASIRVVNWNIQKRKNAAWVGDLGSVGASPDLLILQEASPQTAAWRVIAPGHFASFAEGFGPDWSPSGVMTVSAVQPLAECELVAHEPWFGTRKATLVTEYGLTNSDATLLVVNIHGINFTFGVDDLANQFAQARAIIAVHDGPVLFSGDFNTWRGERLQVLENMLRPLGLTELAYDVDYRKRFFGQTLDHIYVRGLDTQEATTLQSTASDHNPMAAQLRLAAEPRRVRAAR